MSTDAPRQAWITAVNHPVTGTHVEFLKAFIPVARPSEFSPQPENQEMAAFRRAANAFLSDHFAGTCTVATRLAWNGARKAIHNCSDCKHHGRVESREQDFRFEVLAQQPFIGGQEATDVC